jgi:regulator of sigma E protease
MLTTVVAAVIVIGIIVFVHELGHFTAAKLAGVRVETFSLGLGPRLWGFKYGETDYVISAIPFGGFVKMEGESIEEDGEEPSEPPGERSFLGKSKGTRAFIVAAGPAMNFLLAAVIYVILTAWMGVAVFTTKEIGVVDEGSPAWQSGLRAGDEIASVDGKEIQNWDHFLDVLKTSLGRRVDVVVRSDGVEHSVRLDLRHVADLAEVGLERFVPPVADSVAAGSPAERAGIKAGDRIDQVGGHPVRTWQDLARVVEPSPGRELTIGWVRDGVAMASAITPDSVGGVGKIGIMNDYVGEYELRSVGLFEALNRGIRTTAWMSVQFLKLPRLLMQGFPVKDVIGGPVRIGELAGETIRRGAGTFFAFIAALSAQLSLVNLLPIPVLDGGHLFLMGIESAVRRPISTRQRIVAQQIGLALLIALMVFVTLVDVSRLIGG